MLFVLTLNNVHEKSDIKLLLLLKSFVENCDAAGNADCPGFLNLLSVMLSSLAALVGNIILSLFLVLGCCELHGIIAIHTIAAQ